MERPASPDRATARAVTRHLLRGCLGRTLGGTALLLLGGAGLLAWQQGAGPLASLGVALLALLFGAGALVIVAGRRRRGRIRGALEPLGFALDGTGQALSFVARIEGRQTSALVAPGPGLALRVRCAGGQELLAGPQAAVALSRPELALARVECAAAAAGHTIVARDAAWAVALLAEPAASTALATLLAAAVGEPGAGVSIDEQGLLFWSGKKIPGGLQTEALREWLAALSVLATALDGRGAALLAPVEQLAP